MLGVRLGRERLVPEGVLNLDEGRSLCFWEEEEDEDDGEGGDGAEEGEHPPQVEDVHQVGVDFDDGKYEEVRQGRDNSAHYSSDLELCKQKVLSDSSV